jgi:flagellar basal body-associated protein FliL
LDRTYSSDCDRRKADKRGEEMTTKKWILVIVLVAVAAWAVYGLTSTRSKSPATGTLVTPPATAYAITWSNQTYYANSYQQQGNSIVLTNFYALINGKWQNQKGAVILNEKTGKIGIRRLTP